MPVLAATTIGVMGSGSDEYQSLSDDLGALLARLQVNVLTGGGRGVMRAVSRAFTMAAPVEGICIGVLPCARSNPAMSPEGYPNEYVQLKIRTHLPDSGDSGKKASSRNHINILSCDAIVALPGASGTATEVELAVDYRKPILIYTSDAQLVKHFHSDVTRVSTIQEVEDFIRKHTSRSAA